MSFSCLSPLKCQTLSILTCVCSEFVTKKAFSHSSAEGAEGGCALSWKYDFEMNSGKLDFVQQQIWSIALMRWERITVGPFSTKAVLGPGQVYIDQTPTVLSISLMIVFLPFLPQQRHKISWREVTAGDFHHLVSLLCWWSHMWPVETVHVS